VSQCRIRHTQVMAHPWVRGAPSWSPSGSCIYDVAVDPTSGAVHANEGVLATMEGMGFSRSQVCLACCFFLV
jgi:hypothetical protein